MHFIKIAILYNRLIYSKTVYIFMATPLSCTKNTLFFFKLKYYFIRWFGFCIFSRKSVFSLIIFIHIEEMFRENTIVYKLQLVSAVKTQ